VRGWSLTAKSVALLAAYAAVLAAVYGVFTTLLVRGETGAAHDRLEQTARLVAAEIDAQVAAGTERLATVAALPGLVHGLQRLRDAGAEGYIPPWTTLHYLFFKSPLFTGGVFLLDRTGTVLWTEPPDLPWRGRSLAAHPVVAALYRGGGEAVSRALAGDALIATPHVLIGYPIAGSDGVVDGVLGGVIDLGAAGFTPALSAISTAEGRYLAVVDQAGRLLSGTEGRVLDAAPVPDPASLVASAPLAHAPWRVIAGQPAEMAQAPAGRLQRLLLGAGSVLLLLALAWGSHVIRGSVGAIARLTRSAEVMAGGDLSQPVAADARHVELATLARTFDRMRLELGRSHAALTDRLAEREELMRLKEEFLANVSHELRTPLNVIFGYTDMLLDEERDAERRDALARIRAQSEQLLHLVRDLMTLSGLNAGRIALEVAPVHAHDVLARIRPLAQGRAVAATFECEGTVPVLYTDALRLEQVLANLLTNAFKFTPEGAVAVRVRHLAGEHRVVFEVADTGVGIPAHELPHVFDEFRQVDGSMSRRHGGVGLGLALVRRLVALLGGEVSVVSLPGAGSRFTVVVPVEHPALAAGRAA
jgi:signal transduction histidine kinase